MEDSILFFFFFFNLSFFSKYNGLISWTDRVFFFFFREIVVLSQWSTSALKFSHISLRKETRTQGCEMKREIRWKKGESWWNGKRISPTCLHGINGSSLLNSSNDSFCTQNRIFKKKIWIHICLSFNKI